MYARWVQALARSLLNHTLEEVREHLGSKTSLKRVEFVLFDRIALETFEKAFAKMAD